MPKVLIERKDVGYGKYEWFLNGKQDTRSEAEIWEWLEKLGLAERAWGQLNCYGSIRLEVYIQS